MSRLTGNKLTKQLLLEDVEVFKLIHRKIRCRILSWIMPYITYLGGTAISILLPLALIVFGEGRLQVLGWELGISLLFSHLLVQIIKRMASRPRPYKVFKDIKLQGVTIEAHSFPSGHTTASFATALLLSIYFPEYSLLCVSGAMLIGLSRIYLGVHYPSDVLMGAVLGTLFSYFIHFGVFF